MRIFKNLVKLANRSKINHLKKLIRMQEEVIEVHEKTLLLLKPESDKHLKILIEHELIKAKDELEVYKKQLRELDS